MTINVKQGGTWYDAKPHVKIAGSWVEIAEGWVRQAGVWEQVFANTQIFTSTGTRTGVDIYADFGSPTDPGDFIWYNDGDCLAGAGSFAVTTGAFPSGSTLTIVNRGYIRGKGGRGGNGGANVNGSETLPGDPGGTALNFTMDASVDNSAGYLFGGGGGGGGSFGTAFKGTSFLGGGGGGGSDAGAGGSGVTAGGSSGTLTSGGAGGADAYGSTAGRGGDIGQNGSSGSHTTTRPGGAAGKAISLNGYTLISVAGNTAERLKGGVA